jgi:hypothetical protein
MQKEKTECKAQSFGYDNKPPDNVKKITRQTKKTGRIWKQQNPTPIIRLTL